MSKRFLIIMTVLVLGFIGVVAVSKKSSDDTGANSGKLSNHVVGAGKKNVTLVEYGDFQCPTCSGFYSLVKDVQKKFGDDIKFQFRNFPIVQIHQNAMAAHRGAEAAARQGKFWQMYDLIFSRQQAWKDAPQPELVMEAYAKELNLDLATFKKDFQSSEVNSVINADREEGSRLGVTGTPTFFLNGRKLELSSISTADAFNKVIAAEIAASNN